MSDIQEEIKKQKKKAEENDIRLLQERINKAISYIENEMSHLTTNGIRTRKHLLSILKGSDNNE